VTAYKLSYSLDGGKWTYYEDVNEPKVRQYLYVCFEKTVISNTKAAAVFLGISMRNTSTNIRKEEK